MSARNSKNKGSTWERMVGVDLSLWITRGARADLFARSVGSGSRFTRAAQRQAETAQPGDLSAAHELAFPFLRVFMVECKHRRSIDLAGYLFGRHDGQSFLAVTIAKAREEAARAKLQWMVIAKQDHKEPLVFISEDIMGCLLNGGTDTNVRFHLLHTGSGHGVLCFRLSDMIKRVKCDALLRTMERLMLS